MVSVTLDFGCRQSYGSVRCMCLSLEALIIDSQCARRTELVTERLGERVVVFILFVTIVLNVYEIDRTQVHIDQTASVRRKRVG